VKRDFGFDISFDKAKHFPRGERRAGNTSRPRRSGADRHGGRRRHTMIFSIIMVLTDGLRANMQYSPSSTRRSSSA